LENPLAKKDDFFEKRFFSEEYVMERVKVIKKFKKRLKVYFFPSIRAVIFL